MGRFDVGAECCAECSAKPWPQKQTLRGLGFRVRGLYRIFDGFGGSSCDTELLTLGLYAVKQGL